MLIFIARENCESNHGQLLSNFILYNVQKAFPQNTGQSCITHPQSGGYITQAH